MNPTPIPLENQLLEWLHAIREHDDPIARQQLNHLLRTDPAARATMARLLVDEQALINRLRQDGMIAMLNPKPRPASPTHKKTRPRLTTHKPSTSRNPWSVMAAAAIVILTSLLGWLALHPQTPPSPSHPGQAIAVMKAEANAVWKETAPAPGSSLVAGTLMLESGMAAIEFTSGTRILLEGPAELEIISNMHAICRRGKLRANVPPPAHGFIIETPSTRVVDLGTVFGLSVRQDGSAIVKVMQGKVELRRHDSVFPLENNAAALIDPAGVPSAVTSTDEVFPSEENFSHRIAVGERLSTKRWEAAATALAGDTATLLSYDFQESNPSTRSVKNRIPGAALESHGSLVGTGWATGRWPGKRALEFNGSTDRLLFKLSGTSPAATCLAWVRVDSLPNLYHILLMPDTSRGSALQWLLQESGELRIALTNGSAHPATPEGWDGPVKATAISNLDLGRWVFLASTYDSLTGNVIHYRDGHIVGSGTLPNKLPVRFDSFSFGNWARSYRQRRDGCD